MSDNRKNAALAIIATSMFGTAALISPFIILQLRSPLPYMSTPKKKVIAALDDIMSRAKNHKVPSGSSQGRTISSLDKKPPRFFDLGSGDGESVLAAASAGWNATGIELNYTLWGISSLRRMFAHTSIRSKCNFILGDMWQYNIRDADAVMIFGVTPLMPRVAKKIVMECKPGTYVLSYRFRVPLLESAVLVYDKDEMRVYQLR